MREFVHFQLDEWGILMRQYWYNLYIQVKVLAGSFIIREDAAFPLGDE